MCSSELRIRRSLPMCICLANHVVYVLLHAYASHVCLFSICVNVCKSDICSRFAFACIYVYMSFALLLAHDWFEVFWRILSDMNRSSHGTLNSTGAKLSVATLEVATLHLSPAALRVSVKQVIVLVQFCKRF